MNFRPVTGCLQSRSGPAFQIVPQGSRSKSAEKPRCRSGIMAARRLLFPPLAFFLILFLTIAPAAGNSIILVFPPEDQTGNPSLAWIGEGLAMSLSEQCQGPVVDTLGWEERFRFTLASDLPPNHPLSQGSMIRIAQKAGARFVVFGSFSGAEAGLRISMRMLDLEDMRLSGEIVANGPASALPELENELAWLILTEGNLTGFTQRNEFRARTRSVPNSIIARFFGCLTGSDDAARARCLEEAEDSLSALPQASYLLGSYYFQSGDYTSAAARLRSSLRSPQVALDAGFMLGTCLLKQKRFLDAAEAYQTVLLAARTPEVLNNLGIAYIQAGNYPAAEVNLAAAKELSPSNDTVMLNLALVYYLQKNAAAALPLLKQFTVSHPDQALAQYLLGRVFELYGDAEGSAAALDRAAVLGLDPADANGQDPRTWTRIFPSWRHHPAVNRTERIPGMKAVQRH
jgi:tetratricopeptide (TPR) repeat protein